MLVIMITKPVISAEKIHVVYGGVDFSLRVDSLETYAKTGAINQDLGFYTQSFNEQTLSQLREWLQKSFTVDQVSVYRLSNTALGEGLLKEVGDVISTHLGRNGLYPLRAALIAAAGKEKGWGIIDVLREFPTKSIYIDAELLLQLKDQLATLSDYRRAAVEAVKQQASDEATNQGEINITNLADLRQLGPYAVNKSTLTIKKNAIRQTRQGLSDVYTFDVDVYAPRNNPQPSPIIVISHGFGSLRANFLKLAEHFASYGYVAAVPEHIGSDLDYRKRLLAGDVDSVISPLEYTDRPLDITYVLDEFERLAKEDKGWMGKLDLEKIGVVGDSLGAATVLTLAGAAINQPRLEQDCTQANISLDISVILQCRAGYLPPANYTLKDFRIKAVIAAHPLTSSIFGPEGLGQITMPTMMVGGSNDIITAVVQEQIHPFIWLSAKPKYLVLFDPGTHFTSSQPPEGSGEVLPPFLVGKNRQEGSNYFRGLSVAFFGVYLRGNQEYLPYLSAAYNKGMSNDILDVSVIQTLAPKELEIAYGNTPPEPVIPKTVVAKVESRPESIVEEIKKTGVLKVALRSDAAPFGYLDTKGEWTGFCEDLIDNFAANLTEQFKLAFPVEPVRLRSNWENRFNLVTKGDAYFECGPNTIRSDVPKIAFSQPFFLTGTQFLIPKSKAGVINPNLSLEGVKIGVINNTTTAIFIPKTYPDAQTIYLDNSSTTNDIMEQFHRGNIDALASDGVLLMTEAENNKLLLSDFVLAPKIPLTCEYYGLVLPNDDPEWLKLVNDFVGKELAKEVQGKEVKNYLFNNFNYCFDGK